MYYQHKHGMMDESERERLKEATLKQNRWADRYVYEGEDNPSFDQVDKSQLYVFADPINSMQLMEQKIDEINTTETELLV